MRGEPPTESSTAGTAACDDRTKYSLQVLGRESDALPPSRVELLQWLTDREYLLTREESDALLVLVAPSSPDVTSQVLDHFTTGGKSIRLHDLVQEFSRQFFDLTCQERQDRLSTLKRQCAGEYRLMDWLEKLSTGVTIDKPPITGDRAFDELVAKAVEVFVAPRCEGARIRQMFVAESRQDQDTWGRAAAILQLNHQAFVKRIAAWTGDLADWKPFDRIHLPASEITSQPVHTETLPPAELTTDLPTADPEVAVDTSDVPPPVALSNPGPLKSWLARQMRDHNSEVWGLVLLIETLVFITILGLIVTNRW